MTYTAPDGGRWASTTDAAQQLQVPAGTVRVWVHRGRVRTMKVAGRTWVSLDDVEDCERAWRRRRGGTTS